MAGAENIGPGRLSRFGAMAMNRGEGAHVY